MKEIENMDNDTGLIAAVRDAKAVLRNAEADEAAAHARKLDAISALHRAEMQLNAATNRVETNT